MIKTLVFALAMLAVATPARADVAFAHIELPVSYSGNLGPYSTSVAKGSIYVQWSDYTNFVAPSSFIGRVCMSYTDSGFGSDQTTVLLQTAVPPNRFGVVYAATFPNTWSGSGLYHQACGPWQFIVTDANTCGAGWSNTCSLLAWTNGRAYPVVIHSAWIELMYR